MRVEKYGITLRRLTEDDIELVRFHRNSDFIRSKMFYQKIISKEEQKAWFESINNDWNYYFLIDYKDKTVGLVHGTIESYEERNARGGLFIWDEVALNSHLPVLASVCTTDLTFFIMEMERTTAEVRMDNQVAVDYNLSFGYTILETNEEERKVFMELTRENYVTSSNIVRQMVKRIAKDTTDLSWDDITFPGVIPEGLYQNLPPYLDEKLKIKLSQTH